VGDQTGIHHIPVIDLPRVEHDLVSGVERVLTRISYVSHAPTEHGWRIGSEMNEPNGQNKDEDKENKDEQEPAVFHLFILY
jgi:hypothetical protein